MRVLVTGASGRLGRVVLPRLRDEGFTVRAVSRHPREDAAMEWVAADLATGPVRIPGRLGRALRAGGLITTATPTGTRTWADYLADTNGGTGRR